MERPFTFNRETMEQVKLFGAWPSPLPLRVEWALKHKGVEYEYIDEDLSSKSPQLLQLNPVYKSIPVLVHAGKPISESAIIVEYIDETWKNNPILPEDAYERATAHFWAKFGDDKCLPPSRTFFFSTGNDQQKAIKETLEALKALEEHGIKGKKFFGGDEIGFADFFLGWISYLLPLQEEIVGIKVVEPHSFPNLHAWMQRFLDVPVIKENLPPHDKLYAFFKGKRESFLASTATA